MISFFCKGKRHVKNAFAVSVLLCFVLLAGSCGKKERLNIYTWTYYIPMSVREKFEKEYNVHIDCDEYASNEEMYTKLASSGAGGVGYDLIFPSSDYVSILMKQNMIEKIDQTKLTNMGNIDPVVLQKTTYDPQMEYSVPYFWGASCIVVNKGMVPNYEKDWSIFSRTDLKKRMTMMDDRREVIGAALIDLGFSLNSQNPDEINKAADLIVTKWEPNLIKFDSEAFGKGYANGDFWVLQGYPEGVYQEILSDPELLNNTDFFIPQSGGPSYIDSMCIPKGAEHYDMALKFIDFIHRPEIYAEFCEEYKFPSTVNTAARPLVKGISLYKVEDLQRLEVKEDVGEALKLYNAAWDDLIRVGK